MDTISRCTAEVVADKTTPAPEERSDLASVIDLTADSPASSPASAQSDDQESQECHPRYWAEDGCDGAADFPQEPADAPSSAGSAMDTVEQQDAEEAPAEVT